MIVRERDYRALKKQIEDDKDEIQLIRSKIDDLEGELSCLLSDIKMNTDKLKKMEEILGIQEVRIPAKHQPRSKQEITLSVFTGAV